MLNWLIINNKEYIECWMVWTLLLFMSFKFMAKLTISCNHADGKMQLVFIFQHLHLVPFLVRNNSLIIGICGNSIVMQF